MFSEAQFSWDHRGRRVRDELVEPLLPSSQDVRPVLLGRVCGLFLRVIPSPRNTKRAVDRGRSTPQLLDLRISGVSSTSARIKPARALQCVPSAGRRQSSAGRRPVLFLQGAPADRAQRAPHQTAGRPADTKGGRGDQQHTCPVNRARVPWTSSGLRPADGLEIIDALIWESIQHSSDHALEPNPISVEVVPRGGEVVQRPLGWGEGFEEADLLPKALDGPLGSLPEEDAFSLAKAF